MVSLANLEDFLEVEDIHESRKAQYAQVAIPFLITAVVVALVDQLVITLFRNDWLFLGTLLHLAISGLTAGIGWAVQKAGKDCRFFYLLALSNVTMSLLGAVGCIAAYALMLLFMLYSYTFKQWFQTIFPQIEHRRAEVIHDNIISGRDEVSQNYPVIPFMDVMVAGSTREKCDALVLVGERFSPRLSPVLKRAMRDNDNAVRVLAATILGRIENRFFKHSRIIDELLSRKADNDTLTLTAARHYDDYAYTGILDPMREQNNRQRALSLYMQYLSKHPNAAEVMLAVGRLHLRDDRFDEASDWLQRAMNRPETHDRALNWYLECLFELGEYDELRRQSEQLNRNKEPAQEYLRDISKPWHSAEWTNI